MTMSEKETITITGITITGEELSLYEQLEVIRRTEQAAHDLFLAGLPRCGT
jgi:hypothetical protein